MGTRCLLFIFLILTWNHQRVEAQLDPSSALLLRSGSEDPKQNPWDSSRYIKKSNTNEKSSRMEGRKNKNSEEEEEVPKSTIDKVGQKSESSSSSNLSSSEKTEESSPSESEKNTVNKADQKKINGKSTVDDKKDSLENEKIKEEVSPSFAAQLQNLLLGGTFQQMENYKLNLKTEDSRKNIVELSLAPTLLYTDAHSSYWYRKWVSASPAYSLGAQVWVSPFFGVQIDFINSLDGSIPASSSNSNRVSLDQSWFNAGLQWRKFSGVQHKSKEFSFGLSFMEQKNEVAGDSTQRVSTKTTGVRLNLALSLPQSPETSWQLGGFLLPIARHQEISTQIKLSSGTKNSSSLFGVWIGATHLLDRHYKFFWRLQEIVEQNRFEGDASHSDPVNGTTPNGVSVFTGTSLFILGLQWGG
ncbi:MAG: hypothetical protein K1X29_01465 [Bdellovibrionales bacterium]|nr:hypothetical protein [Bdellovibrionales bacterium]